MRRLVNTVVALFAAAAGCDVDLHATADAGPCAPSPAFFASDVWPQYIEANTCAASGCHAFDDGHGYLRFRVAPLPAPTPSLALADWPDAWRFNYLAAVQLVRCDDPTASRLLTVPEGNADPHPPGDSVAEHEVSEELFRDWIAEP